MPKIIKKILIILKRIPLWAYLLCVIIIQTYILILLCAGFFTAQEKNKALTDSLLAIENTDSPAYTSDITFDEYTQEQPRYDYYTQQPANTYISGDAADAENSRVPQHEAQTADDAISQPPLNVEDAATAPTAEFSRTPQREEQTAHDAISQPPLSVEDATAAPTVEFSRTPQHEVQTAHDAISQPPLSVEDATAAPTAEFSRTPQREEQTAHDAISQPPLSVEDATAAPTVEFSRTPYAASHTASIQPAASAAAIFTSLTPPPYQTQTQAQATSDPPSFIRDDNAIKPPANTHHLSTQEAVLEPWLWPLPNKYTSVYSKFGAMVLGKRHKGIDMACPTGTEVYAACGGSVLAAEFDRINGWFVRLQHDDGIISVYCHLDELNCATGDNVSAGMVIGFSGNSGISTGPHLHMGVYTGGQWVDPMQFYEYLQD